jgi:hypothetical protein
VCAKATEPYRQSIPDIHLSLEYCTALVPRDGHYYVIKDDQIDGRFRTLKEAQSRYKQLISQSGYTGPKEGARPENRSPQEVERYLDSLQGYWGDSHKHTRRGGKTMYRS